MRTVSRGRFAVRVHPASACRLGIDELSGRITSESPGESRGAGARALRRDVGPQFRAHRKSTDVAMLSVHRRRRTHRGDTLRWDTLAASSRARNSSSSEKRRSVSNASDTKCDVPPTESPFEIYRFSKYRDSLREREKERERGGRALMHGDTL